MAGGLIVGKEGPLVHWKRSLPGIFNSDSLLNDVFFIFMWRLSKCTYNCCRYPKISLHDIFFCQFVKLVSRSNKLICCGCYAVRNCSQLCTWVGFVSMKFHVQFFSAIFVSMRFLSQGFTMWRALFWDVVVFALQLLHVQRLV